MTNKNFTPEDFIKSIGDQNFDPVKIITLVLLLLIAFGGYSSFYTVQPDEEAVIIRLGKYHGTFPPGLHFKLPFNLDRIVKVKTKLVHQDEFGFRTKSVSGSRTMYSSANYDIESLMLTGDLNVADVEWVVHYQIANPFKYIFQLADPRKTMRDVSESIMRRVVGDRLVHDVLTIGRVEIAAEAGKLMQQVLDKYDIGVRIITVKLQDVNPPKVVQASFNEVNAAKQESEKMINQAEKNYNRVIPEAKGTADKLISSAQGYAGALVNRAEGDAQKFTEMLTEYKKAPEITRKRIYLETMDTLFSKFTKLKVVDPQIKGILPIFGGSTK
ncbi:MAG: FtsH protease activity modulator HflK [Bacteriovoracaceae bacterium]|jgi:modulator of FtsH protease HflK|nr:FtsH protease activity modulator HflK [Bacteriovoracaceae bacterium]